MGVKKRIGILGGTFDPIHMGHLAIARSARSFLNLDYIILIPAGQPLLRQVKPVGDSYQRLAMANLAAESEPWLLVSDIEIKRLGPVIIEGPLLDISAREIRERVAMERPIGHLVHKSVADYINSCNLYKKINQQPEAGSIECIG